jgi:hypothetical protein
MRAAAALLIVGFSLTMAPAVDAETSSASTAVSPPSENQLAEAPPDAALLDPSKDCKAGGDPLSLTGLEEAMPVAVQYCGDCSEPQCQGAIRGQMCPMSGGGWGNCNFYGDAHLCPTGHRECLCGTGPLP